MHTFVDIDCDYSFHLVSQQVIVAFDIQVREDVLDAVHGARWQDSSLCTTSTVAVSLTGIIRPAPADIAGVLGRLRLDHVEGLEEHFDLNLVLSGPARSQSGTTQTIYILVVARRAPHALFLHLLIVQCE